MHDTVVPIEPKVQDGSICADLQRKIPAEGGERILACRVCQETTDDGTDRGRRDERVEDFFGTRVWNLISLMLVAIEVSILVAKLSHLVDFANSVELVSD